MTLPGRMVEMDEDLPEEAKTVAVNLKKTTSNLVRTFYNNQDLLIKLKQFGDARNSDMMQFIDTYTDLQKLWATKLVTPLEEEESMQQQIAEIEEKNKAHQDTRNTKKVQFTKYNEENTEQKEQRDNEI